VAVLGGAPVGDGNDDADAVFAHVSDLHGQLTPRYQVYYDNPTSTPDFNFGDDDRVVERGGGIPPARSETRRTPRGLRRVYAHERRHVPRLRRDHLHRWASDARSRQRPRRARHLCPGNWDYSNEAAEDGNFVELMDDLDARFSRTTSTTGRPTSDCTTRTGSRHRRTLRGGRRDDERLRRSDGTRVLRGEVPLR